MPALLWVSFGPRRPDLKTGKPWSTPTSRVCITLPGSVLPGMVKRNCGHIINLGSVAGTYPYPGGNVYGGTKAFVKQFSKNLLTDLVQLKSG